MFKIAYVFFDLVNAPFPGWEWRSAELLMERGHQVLVIPRHKYLSEKKVPIPQDANIIYASNPMVLDVAIEIKKRINKPLLVQFLDIPKALFGSEPWRIQEYEKVKELVKQADYITSISRTTAKDVKDWCGRNDFVCYLGVDDDIFRSFVPKNGNYIASVVRGLAQQKHHEDVIESVRRSNTKLPLNLIYGQWSDPTKAKIISESLFGIGMSTFEGFALYCAEFGYYSKAFIARKLPVLKEIFEDALEYISNVNEMAFKIALFTKNSKLREKKGKELREIVERKKLFLRDYVMRLEKIMGEIIG